MSENDVKTPRTDIRVRLVGEDGNIFNGKFFVMKSIFLK